MIFSIFFLVFVLKFRVDSITLNKTLVLNDFRYNYESTEIDLSNKDIDKIDHDTFTGMNSLTTLFLHKNKLSQIDEHVFKGLTNLKELWLESNYIISIDKNAFATLKNLERLCLSGNPVSFPVYIADICKMDPKCRVQIFEKCDQTVEITTTKRPASFDGI